MVIVHTHKNYDVILNLVFYWQLAWGPVCNAMTECGLTIIVTLLKTPRPKYSATTLKPSGDLCNCTCGYRDNCHYAHIHDYLRVKLFVVTSSLFLSLNNVQHFPENSVTSPSHDCHMAYLLSRQHRGHSCSNSSWRQS